MSVIGKAIIVMGGYTNLADKTGGDWKNNTRIRSSGALASSTDNDVTNCIAVSAGDVIRIKGALGFKSTIPIDDPANGYINNGLKAVFADTSATTGTRFSPTHSYDVTNDILTMTIPASVGSNKLARFMLFHTTQGTGGVCGDVIITRNEEIT